MINFFKKYNTFSSYVSYNKKHMQIKIAIDYPIFAPWDGSVSWVSVMGTNLLIKWYGKIQFYIESPDHEYFIDKSEKINLDKFFDKYEHGFISSKLSVDEVISRIPSGKIKRDLLEALIDLGENNG